MHKPIQVDSFWDTDTAQLPAPHNFSRRGLLSHIIRFHHTSFVHLDMSCHSIAVGPPHFFSKSLAHVPNVAAASDCICKDVEACYGIQAVPREEQIISAAWHCWRINSQLTTLNMLQHARPMLLCRHLDSEPDWHMASSWQAGLAAICCSSLEPSLAQSACGIAKPRSVLQ